MNATDLEEQFLTAVPDLFFIWSMEEKKTLYVSRDPEGMDNDQYLLELIHPDHHAKFRFMLNAISPENGTHNYDFPGSGVSWINLRTFPLGTASEVTRVVGQLTDVSQRKEEHDRMEALIKRNEHVVRSMVHDIKNPVNVMTTGLQFAEMALIKNNADEALGILKMLRNAGRRTFQHLQTLHHLLEFWSLDLKMMIQQVNFTAFIDKMVADHREAFIRQRLKVITEIPDQDIPVKIDPGKFRIAVEQLLSNARRFTPENGTVIIRVYEKGSDLYLSISDTGPGIPEERRGAIFETFTPSRKADVHGESSSGVGLAITKQIVELHGGTISLQSDPTGSTFIIQLKKVNN